MLNVLLNILYSLPGIIIGFTIHEFAHAKVADALGDPTPRMMGRVTLDPLSHMDPIGTIMLLIAGFGWGKPVRINPSYFKKIRRDSVLVAVAGPLANLSVAVAANLLYVGLLRLAISTGHTGDVLSKILIPCTTWNALLFSFNLLPFPPLDGYKVIKGLAKHPSNRFFAFMDKYGYLILILLFFTGVTSRLVGFVASLINLPINLLTGRLFRF